MVAAIGNGVTLPKNVTLVWLGLVPKQLRVSGRGIARCQAKGYRSPAFSFDMSERRACMTIDCDDGAVSLARPSDNELRQRLRALAYERRRFGYRRLHVLLRRERFKVNHKRLFRFYREERLMVRRRGEPWEPARRCWCRNCRTNVGPSTLWPTSSSTAVAYASC
jgi:hypothetical protein